MKNMCLHLRWFSQQEGEEDKKAHSWAQTEARGGLGDIFLPKSQS